MADQMLTTDLSCPKCQAPHPAYARRCHQCHYEFERGDFSAAAMPAPCPACGRVNVLSRELCVECGASMLPQQDPAEVLGLRPNRTRRRSLPLSVTMRGSNPVVIIRLVSVLYLFWSIIDNSNWLAGVTATLAPEDPAALRYNIFALYEIVRNMGLVAGVWLLTMLRPRRGA